MTLYIITVNNTEDGQQTETPSLVAHAKLMGLIEYTYTYLCEYIVDGVSVCTCTYVTKNTECWTYMYIQYMYKTKTRNPAGRLVSLYTLTGC